MAILTDFHVASGSFIVGETEPRRLQAFLGTCVGVAVFDATAGVGGLAHLLLPEPVGTGSLAHPEKYATTAMPLFLNRLTQLGATPENMRAVVAGGALVGPLTPLDIDLDIGGRTAETALDALQAAGIQVLRTETGGFFTCCLELDMQHWRHTIQPSGLDAERADSPARLPVRADIQHSIEAIQPIPQVALKVLRIMQQESYDIHQVAEEIKKDQVICARTIQLSNSAMFSKHQEVTSLDHALVYLGKSLFLKLVISAAVQRYYGQSGIGYSLCKGGLYHHAIGTAVVAERIAVAAGAADPGAAYIAGLLHDIGKVVLDQHVSDAYPLLYREFQNRQTEIITVENQILGIDHTRVGALLADRWSLPRPLQNVIRFHHQPEENADGDTLTVIVYLSDLLMSRFHSGLELERINTQHIGDHLARLSLSAGQFRQLVDLIPETVFEPASETLADET
ncbi:CheD: predicted chemoreceptor glutamine deaminase [Desulfosarcina cetonica]|uniref:HDOD domain-containing protein n=1 Tax=Desulfosarcina cetonica TaxID=90730 RepID=UPI0006D23AC1|nr:HDOD domain-containing protein [Desulfosarcina cetonica]VTR70954.1 CheD: predicted chemoreceptor glutamine deaminase [Desulfosarcina cetonica]